ncbi:phage holin family protein [Cohnella faecalis]|uniref:Holin n=1 Tax=Cohnella faecalis TaxID=2315694 RepID=A0A398CP27_9BACL|nr:phage holin family protein [Cohnella faecalis]RIE01291.1 holin [Cohnella faecalis]
MDKLITAAAGGFLFPVFEYFYGPGSAVASLMVTLLFFISMDWLSGSRASKKDKTYSSRYGIDGVFRMFFMLLLPAGGHLLDVAFGTPGIVFGVFVFGLLYHTIKSMTANAIRAGWADWLPIHTMEKVTGWVQSEMEYKLSRAAKRMEEREGTPNGKAQ